MPADSPAPRSLAEDLRLWDTGRIAHLLRERPDLVTPAPLDITALAGRAGSSASTSRVLARLDRFTLQVAEVVAALPDPTTLTDVLGVLPEHVREPTQAAVQRLHDLALIWGNDDALHVVRTVHDLLGPYPCGLGPSMADVRPLLADHRRTRALLAQAPAEARAVVRELAVGPPIGRVQDADRPVSIETARTPIEWLLARDLLVPRGPNAVILPRDVALVVRGDPPMFITDPAWPPRAVDVGAASDAADVDRAAGVHALQVVTAVGDLLDGWSEDPPSILRKGGLSVRDLASTAALLHADEVTTALVIEVAYAAGLVCRDEAGEWWRPTWEADAWLLESPVQQWIHLVNAWWATSRAPALVRGLGDAAESVNGLTDDVSLPHYEQTRQQVVRLLADLPCGAAPISTASVCAAVRDRLPRLSVTHRDDHVAAIVREAEILGVTGRGALSSAGRLLAAEAGDEAVAAAADLPALVDHVVLQADLTAIAPGPLTWESRHALKRMADVESTGGATVFRFSESSIQRALAAGDDAATLQRVVTDLSRTPVPQPLAYLIDDLARRQASLHIDTAASYITCEDPTTLAALVADPRAQKAGLRSPAPGIIVSSLNPENLRDLLQEMGYPVDTASGSIRTRERRRAPTPPPAPQVDDERIMSLARALTRGATAVPTSTPPDDLTPMPASDTLAALRAASASEQRVWIAYEGTEPTVVEAIRLRAGLFTGVDLSTGSVRTYAVPRITAVRPV